MRGKLNGNNKADPQYTFGRWADAAPPSPPQPTHPPTHNQPLYPPGVRASHGHTRNPVHVLAGLPCCSLASGASLTRPAGSEANRPFAKSALSPGPIYAPGSPDLRSAPQYSCGGGPSGRMVRRPDINCHVCCTPPSLRGSLQRSFGMATKLSHAPLGPTNRSSSRRRPRARST